MSEFEIRKTIEINASPKTVFKALTDENELTQWFPDQAVLEPKIGGKMKFTFLARKAENLDRDFYPRGEILEFEPDKKLSYSWIPEGVPDFPKTIVTWTLEKIAENKTRVKLVHSGFTGKPHEMQKEHTKGWEFFSERLSKHCERND